MPYAHARENEPQSTPHSFSVNLRQVVGVTAGGGWTLVAADYSQLELRIMAHFSKDEALRHIFHKVLGWEDSHAYFAFATIPGFSARDVSSLLPCVILGYRRRKRAQQKAVRACAQRYLPL